MFKEKFSKIPFVQVALDRLSMHYHDGLKTRAFLSALIELFLDLQDVAFAIPTTYDIDKATGVDLDMIGDILGFSRNYGLELDLSDDLFSFDEEDHATSGPGMSEEDDDSVGGYWKEEGEGAAVTDQLSDDLYRLFLKAKTLSNRTRCTLEDIMTVFRTIFPDQHFSLTKTSPMNLVLRIEKKSFQPNILKLLETTDIIPRGAGVSLQFKDLSEA